MVQVVEEVLMLLIDGRNSDQQRCWKWTHKTTTTVRFDNRILPWSPGMHARRQPTLPPVRLMVGSVQKQTQRPYSKAPRITFGVPAVPTLEVGVECGSLPVASGSFSWNAHNGDLLLRSKVTNDVSFESGTAGISVDAVENFLNRTLLISSTVGLGKS